MISVPSLLPRLNGNSALLILCCLIFWQCNTSKKTSKTAPRTDRDTRGDVTRVDTIRWDEADDDDVITIDPDLEDLDITDFDDSEIPTLSVVLPLNAEKISFYGDEVSAKDEALIQYYVGWKLGIADLNNSDAKLNVRLIDANDDMSRLRDIDFKVGKDKPGYLFGGLGREQVEYLANYAREQNLLYVSNWQTNSTFLEQNENYVQLSPGFQAHVLTILKHALKEFSPDQIMLFGSRKEQSRIDEINRLYRELTGSKDLLETFIVESMEELELLEIEEWQPDEEDEEGEKVVVDDEKLVFIVPVTRNFDLIHDFFRFLDFNVVHDRSVIYGITDWNDEMLYDHLNNFDVRLTSFWNPGVQKGYSGFVENFYSMTGDLPDQKAYEGYGHAILMSNLIREREANKGEFSDKVIEGHGMKARIVDHNRLETPGLDNPLKPSYFENEYVQLLQFEDYRYKLFEY